MMTAGIDTVAGPQFHPGRVVAGIGHLFLVVLLAVVLPLAPIALAADFTIKVTSKLDPATITVPPGSRIVWQNQDGERHRFRTTSGPVEFDTGDIDAGASASVTLNTEGTYSYIDERDDDNTAYHGTIVVQAGASGTTTTTVGSGGGTGPAEVRMAGRVFSPSSVTIAAGGSVKFINDDDRDHTATGTGGSFDSGIMASGATFTKTFSTAGTYSYLCLLHPDMTGTVTVTGSGGTAPPTTAPPPTSSPVPPVVTNSDVSVFDFGYSPSAKSVAVGSTIRFVNTGAALHTVTDTSGRFDSGLIQPGAAWSRRFDQAGTYPVFCTLHPEMKATITVTDAGGSAPPPPAPTTTSTVAAGSVGSGGVEMRDFSFAPGAITVRVGASLRFVNTGAAPHTATAVDKSFDSGIVQPGGSFTARFSQPGIFRYICTLHPQMIGSVTVLDASGSAPTTTEGPTDTTTAGEPGSEDAAVEVVDLAYVPAAITVPLGTRVIWTNTGVAPHTVTARDQSFTSELMETGDTYARVFDAPGRFEYFCTLHPDMVGWVTVEEGDASDGDGIVAASSVGDDGSGGSGATRDPRSGLGWIAVGSASALVFGGGAVIFGMLRRELFRY